MSNVDFTYAGSELDLFAQARRWKEYWSGWVRPYCRGRVLEVGAGIGTNTRLLMTAAAERWVCLEPDSRLLERLRGELAGERIDPRLGTTADLPPEFRADAILYVDVLEHIEDDARELARAASLLDEGGTLVVLSPAHGFLYSPFDRSIGHHRRYDRASLRAVMPRELRLEQLVYLDSAGMLASLANRTMLRQSNPTQRQILFWDRRLVPVSTVLDRLFAHRLGKSILGVFKK